MDEKPMNEQAENSAEEPVPSSQSNAWPWGAAVVLSFLLVITLVLFVRAQDSARQMQATNAQMNAELSQLHDQVSDLSARVNALLATPPAPTRTADDPSAQASESQTARRPKVRHAAAQKHPREDPRWKQLQAQLAENKQQIQATQQQVASNRQEMEGNLNSTRDNLNGSIAKTHDELVALEKKGERSYYEFNLSKSKGFDRVGPVSLSLRKTNLKHGYYDMAVLVEDSRLDKKHISLFEPVLFYPSDSHRPLELVVNRIEKNYVEGYVSAPKYKESQTAAISPPTDQGLAGTKTDLPHRPADQQ
jgi:type II secretory pathway pseudopilin PulG